MATAVIMPRQGQSVENCIITSWNKKKGDRVEAGEILFSYETDKSAFDEPSPVSGTVLEIMYGEGDVVDCLENVCVIGEEGEDISSVVGGASSTAAAEAKPETAEAVGEKAEAKAVVGTEAARDGNRVFISPRAKNLALSTGADMSKVTASGPHGRIIERDIDRVLDAGERAGTAAVEAFLRGEELLRTEAAEASPKATEAPAVSAAAAEYTDKPLSGVRRAISRTMHASLSEMAQLTLNASFDATEMMSWARVAEGERRGSRARKDNDKRYCTVRGIPCAHAASGGKLGDDR